MRARTAIALPLAALALVAFGAGGSASAAELPFHLPSSAPKQLRTMVAERVNPSPGPRLPHPLIRLRENGYAIAIVGDGNHVLLEVARPNAEAVTVYVARGVATRRKIEATFGDLGRISVRFHPRGTPPARVCRNDRLVSVRHGVFVGQLKFDGEDGYLGLDERRARGKVSTVVDRCVDDTPDFLFRPAARPSTHKGKDAGPAPRILVASWRQPLDSAGFLALEFFGVTLYLAITENSGDGMAIEHIAFGIAGPRTFTLDDALTRASIAPQAPFHGRGTYTAAPDGTTSWTGTLSANFPGAPRYPFAGPPFTAELAAGFEHQGEEED